MTKGSEGKQSRVMSLVEAVTNVVVGFLLALLAQLTFFPMFGLAVSFANNIIIGLIFTGVSVLRSFTLRRVFEAFHLRRTICQPEGRCSSAPSVALPWCLGKAGSPGGTGR